MRVSLDLDLPATLRDALQAAQAVTTATGAAARVYRTRSGGHHVETDDIPGLTLEDALTMRRTLGDDPQRLARDMERIAEGRAFDFLFTKRRNTQRVRLL